MNTENNKIVAEFMGYKLHENKYLWIKEGHTPYIELLYDTSWDSLMEVVEKIESLDGKKYYVVIKHTQCKFANYYTEETIANVIHTHNKMQSVYLACLEFIKWYNENAAKRN